MYSKNASKNRRTLAVIMSVLLIFFILFVSLFIVIESDHDCTGEHCPICEYLHVFSRILNISDVLLLFKAAVSGISVLSFAALLCCTGMFVQENPVKDKVRMNN